MRIVLSLMFSILVFSGSAYAQGQPSMEELKKLASPGENHKFLGKSVGEWEIKSKMWTGPNQPPIESTGSMHVEWVLGKRFVRSVWKGKYMGEPFEGHSLEGYDNISKMFVGTWADTTGTGIVYSTAKCDLSKQNCTSVSEAINPIDGKKLTTKWITNYVNDDTFKSEMYSTDGSGKDVKVMELTAKRKGSKK